MASVTKRQGCDMQPPATIGARQMDGYLRMKARGSMPEPIGPPQGCMIMNAVVGTYMTGVQAL